MIRTFFQLRYLALREALACIGLGLRDVRHAGLWWRSSLCSIAALGLWLWLYVHFGTFFLQLSGVATLVAIAGLSALGMLEFGPGIASGPATLSNMGSLQGLGGLAKSLLSIAQVALFSLAVAAAIYALVFVVGALFSACMPARLLGLERARAVVARRYPAWQPTAPGPRPALTAWSCVRVALGMLGWLVPLWSMLLLLRLFAALNVRLLYGPAAAGVLPDEWRRGLAVAQKPAIVMLGLLLLLMMMTPVLNLLVPALACTSVCHLQRRGWTNRAAIGATAGVAPNGPNTADANVTWPPRPPR